MSKLEEDILKRNVADLEIALRTQIERAEAAEAALKEAQEQEPVAWLHDKEGRVDVCHDSVKKLWLKVGQQQNTQFMREVVPCRVEHYNIPLYAAANPAAVLELIRQRDELLAALKDARELVEDWGAYAPAYMQEKRDLEGDLSRLDAVISKMETP